MNIHRPTPRIGAASFILFVAWSAPASSFEKLSGVVSSVDLEGRKLVVTPTGQERGVDVKVNDQTEFSTESGNAITLKEIKAGDGVGLVHNAGLASKVLVAVKPSELTGHVKSVGATLKTFVVTETGTTTDVTVAITPETSFVTTAGKKLELKELKKGDGVGISHTNSVASQVVVNVKPVEKETR